MSNKKTAATAPQTMTFKPSEVAAAIKHLLPTQVAAFLWGPPGIGKSAVLKQVAESMGMGFVDIRLSQMEPTDIRGIPYPVEEEIAGVMMKGMRWSAPLVLPHDPKAKVLILLDEFNSAPPSVQAAAYQLVLDRKLGEYEVPEGCMIVAAGNRETDKGVTFRMPTPLANRFVHIEMRHDFEDWQVHALNSKFNKDVVGFLTAFKNKLFQFEALSASRGFATPRSWEFVSRIVEGNPDLPETVLTGLVAGAIGDGNAVEFMEYRRNAADLPNPDDILNGKNPTLSRVDVSLCYALTTALCYQLREGAEKIAKAGKPKDQHEAWLKQADNFLGYMLEHFQPEICVMGAKTALSTFKLGFNAKQMKNFEKFADKYKHLIMN
jgi:MoxR-like ATPase